MTENYDEIGLLNIFFREYAFSIINILLFLCLVIVILIGIRLVFLYIEKKHIEAMEGEEKKNVKTKENQLSSIFGREELKKNIMDEGSLVYINLNGLRNVNKEKGYAEGDKQILKIAKLIQKIIPEEGVVYRINGDEFAIDLPAYRRIEAENLALRLSERVERNEELDIGIALGIVEKNDVEVNNFDSVISKAEEYMHKNKLTARKSIRSNLIYTLLDALGEKSFETEEHALRLKVYALKIGKMMNLAQEDLNELTLLAYLHDIGKISIPDSILTKTTRLDSREWEIIKTHPKTGADLIKNVPDLASISKSVLSHHENWDGTGYPNGLKKYETPLAARIIRVVDSYDAMTSNRNYNIIKSKKQAMEDIIENSETMYDPDIVEVFARVLMNESEMGEDYIKKTSVVNL